MKKIAIFIIISIMSSITSADRGMLRGMLMDIETIEWVIKIDKNLRYKIISIDRDAKLENFWSNFSQKYNYGITKDYERKQVTIRKSLVPSFVELNKESYLDEQREKLISQQSAADKKAKNKQQQQQQQEAKKAEEQKAKKAEEQKAKKAEEDVALASVAILDNQQKNHIRSKAKVVNAAKKIKEKMFAMQEDFYDRENKLQANILNQKKFKISADKIATYKIEEAQSKLEKLTTENKQKAEVLRSTKEKINSLEIDNAIKQSKLNALMAKRGELKIIRYNSDSAASGGSLFGTIGSGFLDIGDGIKNIFSGLHEAGMEAADKRRESERKRLVSLSDKQMLAIESLTKEANAAKMEVDRLMMVKDISNAVGVEGILPVGNTMELEESISSSAKEIREDIKTSEQRQAELLVEVNSRADKSIKIMKSVIVELSALADSVNLIREKVGNDSDYSDKVKLNKILNKIKEISKGVSVIRKENAEGLTDLSIMVAKSATSIGEEIIRLEGVILDAMVKTVKISTDNAEALSEIKISTSGLDRNVKSLKAKLDSMYYNIFNITTSLDSYQGQTKRGLQDITKETKTQTEALKNLLNITSAGLYHGRTSEEKIKRLLNNLFDIDSVNSINVGNKYDKETEERILAIHIDEMYLKSGEINSNKVIKNKDLVFKFSPEGLISIGGIKDNQTIRYIVNQWYHEEYKDFKDAGNGTDLVTKRDSEVLVFEKKSDSDPKENELSDRIPVLYETHCYSCHESEYRGAIPMKDSRWDAIIKAKGVSHLFGSVVNGMDYMPIKGSCESCTEQEILYLIKYLSTE